MEYLKLHDLNACLRFELFFQSYQFSRQSTTIISEIIANEMFVGERKMKCFDFENACVVISSSTFVSIVNNRKDMGVMVKTALKSDPRRQNSFSTATRSPVKNSILFYNSLWRKYRLFFSSVLFFFFDADLGITA